MVTVEKASELVTSSADEFIQEVEENSYNLEELQQLLDAEKSGKDRDAVKEALNQQITSQNLSKYLDVARDNVEVLERVVDQIEGLEDAEKLKDSGDEIEKDRLLDLTGGTVEEIEQFVQEEEPGIEQLQELLKAEKTVKNRKTAKEFLSERIKERKIGLELFRLEEDIEEVEEDLEDLDELEPPLREQASEESDEQTGSEEPEQGEESGEQQEDSGEDQEETEEEASETEDSSESQEEDQDPDEDGEASQERSGIEEKRELADRAGLDYSDEKLEEISVEALQETVEEMERREELVKKLKSRGLEESKLEESSLDDLEKLEEQTQEDIDEMKEEAEEDLQMLMGAAKSSEEEDEARFSAEKIEEFKERFSEAFSSGEEEEESSELDPDDVEKVLEDYRSIGGQEGVIKAAHVMKAYLEKDLGIERELTYKELASEMEDRGRYGELADFYRELHREQYTGDLSVEDPDSRIELLERPLS